MDWSSTKRLVASLVTVAASSMIIVLPILITNPTDAKTEAASRLEILAPGAFIGQMAVPSSNADGDSEPRLQPKDLAPAPRPRNLAGFIATAYAIQGTTSSGVKVRRGIVAADPDVLPIGSIIRVHSSQYSGIYTVLDTGASVQGRMIDIYVPTRAEALRFGSRRVKVEVLRHGWRPETSSN